MPRLPFSFSLCFVFIIFLNFIARLYFEALEPRKRLSFFQKLNVELFLFNARDAGAIVGQEGQRGTQGQSRPKASEVSRKSGGPGVLSGKVFGASPFRLA